MFKRSNLYVFGVIALFALISGCTPLDAVTSYQGQLTDSLGNPVADGNYQITFRLYNAEDDDVGDALWTETQTVSLIDGLFNVMLGANTTIPTELFAQKLWLGVEVESDGEMTPRQQLTGAPYAMSLVAGAGIQGAIDKDETLPGSLNVRNSGTGYGIGVNALGKAGLAIDGSSIAENGLLIDSVLHGGVITSTDGTGLFVHSYDGEANDYYGLAADSEIGDGVFGRSYGLTDTDTGVTGRGNHGYGIYGFTDDSGQYAGYFGDPIFVSGGCTGCTLRYVVRNTSEQTLTLGDTVTASGIDVSLAGLETPVIQVSLASIGESILGVVVGQTEMFVVEPGLADAQPGVHFGKVGGDAAPGDYLVIVVQGLAQVRAADASTTAGDLVYLGAQSVSTAASGPAIGMALDVVDADGLVWVLVGFD